MCASVKTSPPETPTTRCEVPTKSNGRGARSGGGKRRRKIETRLWGLCTPGQAGNDYIVRERSAKWLQLRLLLEDLGQVSVFFPSSSPPSFLLLSFFSFLSLLLFRHLASSIEYRAIISLASDIAIDRDRSRDTVTGRTDPPPPPPLPARGLSNKFTGIMDRPLEIPPDTGGTPLLALSALCPFESVPRTENASCSSRRYRLVPRRSSNGSSGGSGSR